MFFDDAFFPLRIAAPEYGAVGETSVLMALERRRFTGIAAVYRAVGAA
jgi:hypothetical protein